MRLHPDSGPLAGVRVLELGSTVAGPFCGRLLADFGAEVIKVEPPEGDAVRTMGKHKSGASLYAASILRNKSLITIDMRRPAGRSLACSLALECDAVVENFRPGTLEKWRMGYDEISVLKPSIVYVRISGFGQTGPYAGRPGYGVIGEAISGLRHVTGDADRPPARVAVSLTDYITGLYGAFGTALALLHCKATGKGQVVDCALYESAFSFMEPHVPAFDKLGTIANRAGSRLPGSNPNNLYPAQSGAFIHITAMANPVFRRLCAAMKREDLAADPRFESPRVREENHAELDSLIAAWTSSLSVEELETLLAQAEVPATRIFRMDDIFRDQHFKARQMLVETAHDVLGSVVLSGPVPKLSRTPGEVRHAGREVGADTRAVLKRVLHMADDQIDELVANGTIVATGGSRT